MSYRWWFLFIWKCCVIFCMMKWLGKNWWYFIMVKVMGVKCLIWCKLGLNVILMVKYCVWCLLSYWLKKSKRFWFWYFWFIFFCSFWLSICYCVLFLCRKLNKMRLCEKVISNWWKKILIMVVGGWGWWFNKSVFCNGWWCSMFINRFLIKLDYLVNYKFLFINVCNYWLV